MRMKEFVKGVMMAGLLLVTSLGANAQDETVQKFEPEFPHALIFSPKEGVNMRVAPSPKARSSISMVRLCSFLPILFLRFVQRKMAGIR